MAAMAGWQAKCAGVLRQKLASDIGWSIGSLVILAGCGILINLVVAYSRNAEALGVFSQAFAVYLIAAQVSALGLHYSVLRHTALYDKEQDERDRLATTAGLIAIALGAVGGFAVWVASGLIGRAFGSADVGTSVAYSCAGIALFPFNKVLLSFLNGLRAMRAFAVLQSVRYLTVLAGVSAVALSSFPFERVTLALLVAEIVTLGCGLFYVARRRLVKRPTFSPVWVGRHLTFGMRSLMSGLFVELNSRVDVLVIGMLLPDRAVGIYAFANMFFDGLYHLLVAVRNNFNPLLVVALRDGDGAAGERLMRNSKSFVLPGTLIVAVLLLAVFHVLTGSVLPGKGLDEGLVPLVVLMGTMVAVSPFIPFENLLIAGGYPGHQTLQHLSMVVANVTVGFLLVPWLGILGGAVGAAVSFATGAGVLIYLSRHLLGWEFVSSRVAAR